MKRIILIFLVAVFLGPSAFARKTTYIVTNHRLDFVKLSEVKIREAEARAMTHPKEISEDQMRAILKSIKLSRRHIISKEVDTQDAFNESSVNFLSGALSNAFRSAGPTEEVIFSYLMKDPTAIIRDDRLNIANLWVHEDELHIHFQKLYAKVTSDIDKRGNFANAVARSRGLRIDFDLGPGQTIDLNSPDELIVDLKYDFGAQQGAVAASAPVKEVSEDVKGRLQKLEELKREKLITDKEYKEKRGEILRGL